MIVNKKNIGITLILISILIFIYVMFVIGLSFKNKEVNEKLNEEQQKYLFKSAIQYLNISEDFETGSIEKEAMVKYSVAYMGIVDEYKNQVTYDYDNNIAIAKTESLMEIVKYIFDVQDINFKGLGFKQENGYTYVSINTQGGDAKLYSYNKTVYNEQDNTYVAYINILDSMGANSMEQLQNPISSYEEEYIEAVMLFKYTVKENRKILLAFTIESAYSN